MTGGDVTIVDPAAVSAADVDNGQDTAALNITYTVTDAVPGADHSIELFEAANVTVDADGVVTFVDNAGLADTGTVTAALWEIISVNGDTAVTGDSITEFRPAADTFTFTVQVDEGSANSFESVVPVVYFDDGAATGGVEVGTDGVPASDAVFGVGGQIEVLPVETATGGIVGDSEILLVDTERGILVIDNNGAAIEHVAFASTDDFFVLPGGEATNPTDASDLAGFEARVTAGDDLDANTNYSRSGVSEFVLNDLLPAEVAGVTATVTADDSVTITWTDDAAADSYTIYRAESDDLENGGGTGVITAADEAAFVEVGTFASDADPTDDEFVDSGLTANTAYVYWVTQTQGAEETVFNSGANVAGTPSLDEATTAATVPTVTDAVVTTDNVLTGAATDTDVFTLVFSEAMDAVAAGDTITVTDGDGDVFIFENNAPATVAGGTAAAFLLAGDNVTLTVTLAADAVDTNAAGNGVAEYPLTITATSGITATASGLAPNLAGSADVVIDVE